MKFKVGQEVIVRNDLIKNHFYNKRCRFAPEMEKYLGKRAHISWVSDDEVIYDRIRYHLDIAWEEWYFSNDMLVLPDNIFVNLENII